MAEREAAWFWKVVARGAEVRVGGAGGKGKGVQERIERNGEKVERVRVDAKGLGEGMKERYEEALERLKEDVLGNGRG